MYIRVNTHNRQQMIITKEKRSFLNEEKKKNDILKSPS